MTKLEKRIDALEELACPGRSAMRDTQIVRVNMDNRLFEREGLDPKKASGRESTLVWCLALGYWGYPKAFFHGITIGDAIKKAEEAFAAANKEKNQS
jgi:hypothetical protein